MVKYKELAEQLKQELTNSLSRGLTRLPTEQELCRQYQVSRQTVRQALSLLEQEALIIRKQGSGSYATGLLPEPSQNKIALMLSSDTEYLSPALLQSLESLLSEEGYTVSSFLTDNRTDRERSFLQELIDTPVRGLIAEPFRSALPTPNYDLYEELAGKGTGIVFINGYYPNLSSPLYVADDNYAGGFLLGQFLIQQRHRQIAGIFQMDTLQGQERYLGFARAMLEAGLPASDTHIGWFSSEDLLRLEKSQDTGFLSDFISRRLTACSAVVCQNDEIAYWLIKRLLTQNIHVPGDISVASFDNSYLCELSAPRLTSLAHKPQAAASCAVLLLLQKLKGQAVSPIRLPWNLIQRGSTTLWTD